MPIQIALPKLHDGQQNVYDSDARFKVVCCGRRWGKTHYGVLECIICACERGQAWWIAPTYQVASIGWTLLKAMVRPIPGIEVREVDKRINFPGGGWVSIKTGDRPDLLRGESLDFVVFDEVADIKEEVWTEAIRPALADRRGKALFIGTPRGMANWFYDLFLKGEADGVVWASFQQPTTANPHIPPDEIEEARKDMHPLLFNQEFLAEFVVAGGQVFHVEWERWYNLVGEQQMYSPDSSLVLSHGTVKNEAPVIYQTCGLSQTVRFATVDLAVSTKTTADFTVIATWAKLPKAPVICLLDVVRKRMEGPDILPAIQEQKARWKLAYVGIERTAFQLSMVQAARRKGLPVRELTPDKDKYSRAYNAAAHMQSEHIWYRRNCPNMDDWLAETRAFDQGIHDDCVDTMSYAAFHLEHARHGRQLGSF